MVYSAVEMQSLITETALTTAISIGNWLQRVALDAFGNVGRDSFSKAEKIVLDIVRRRGKTYRRSLQQSV